MQTDSKLIAPGTLTLSGLAARVGVEPTRRGSKPRVLPLDYRAIFTSHNFKIKYTRIRTYIFYFLDKCVNHYTIHLIIEFAVSDFIKMEQATRFELALFAWKANVLP